ncbi:hypothetical protein SAMN04488128_103784 [Chitinophaga eiseniae]|uniref:PRTRC system protein F n=1 Tax=Chitinophaga eiseniae TaxID=634771 RepID=A0A1T4SY86_9BACT|nr:hypothetical protein [Chitinophaga eiseniae]SKA33175.1 hypothetical protein SAMN04488128_103784 [Chitinophaga eiseniae]
MDHATTYHIGTGSTAAKYTTADTTPAIKGFLSLDAAAKGRRRGKKGQTQAGSPADAANAFLKCQFLPKLFAPQSSQDCGDTALVEQQFYDSLSELCTHYNITPIPSRQYGYPYNVTLALWDTERKLKDKVENWQTVRLTRREEWIFITSIERIDTGPYLYYIPVIPLYKMLHDCQHEKAGQLLLSLCSYLYQVAGIPYYRNEGSFLYWQYEMMEQWVAEEEDCEGKEEQLKEIEDARQIGDYIYKEIAGMKQLNAFAERLAVFGAGNDFEKECFDVAASAFALYTQFPNECIFRNGSREEEQEDYDEYYGDVLSMDKYISFYADTKGLLSENLCSTVNMNFDECIAKEEPCIQKHFDGEPVTGDLSFEMRLFALIGDLCYILENF